MKIEEIVGKIETTTGKRAVRIKQDSYRMYCPVHSDKKPSFVLSYGSKNGKKIIIGHCFGCKCTVQEWSQAIGITLSDLFECD